MSQPARYPSPLRYPGGKGKIANYVKVLILENGLVGYDYVEPYAGGASIALSLLYEDFADRVYINDLNRGIYSFWRSAVLNTDMLCSLILDTPVTIDEWQRQRSIAGSDHASEIELGFATFFLNRTNRSGIIGGGVIGGLEQAGAWKIDARFNKDRLVQRIQKVGRYRTRISVSNEDAAEFVGRWTKPGEGPAFLYMDPPYFEKGEGLYDNFYARADHAAIAHAVRALAHPWIVSYDAHPHIVGLYSGVQQVRYRLSYSANHAHSLGSEIMFYSDDLTIPNLLPSGVQARRVAEAQRLALGR